MKKSKDYELYGEEWKKEMMKWEKEMLVAYLAEKLKDHQKLLVSIAARAIGL